MTEPYKTDCYYYTEVHDMGACIQQCTRYKQLGKCPCDNCTNYISNKEVHLVIQDYARNKQKEVHWIPVSERLPEDVGGEYLVNIEYKGKHEGIDIAEYQIGGYMDGLWITPNDWIEGPSELWHVTAWMPLPEPYKAESEE